MARYIAFLVLQLKNCLGWGWFIGIFCLRVVLSAKHLVINRGHNNTCMAAAFDWISKIL